MAVCKVRYWCGSAVTERKENRVRCYKYLDFLWVAENNGGLMVSGYLLGPVAVYIVMESQEIWFPKEEVFTNDSVFRWCCAVVKIDESRSFYFVRFCGCIFPEKNSSRCGSSNTTTVPSHFSAK